MKPVALVAGALAAFVPAASAWSLELWATDGRKATMHGTLDSGCKNIEFTPALDVKRAKFNPKTDHFPDPGTFELYVNNNCHGLSYRNGGGDYRLTPPRKIRSYKVY